MGANKFGPPGWQGDPEWKGWWGDDPPFHTPVFVLTHTPREPVEMQGGTTFHFLEATPVVVRAFLSEGLVDHMHLVQVPIVLGRGVRLWDGLEALEEGYDVEAVSSPSGVTHLTFTRRT